MGLLFIKWLSSVVLYTNIALRSLFIVGLEWFGVCYIFSPLISLYSVELIP